MCVKHHTVQLKCIEHYVSIISQYNLWGKKKTVGDFFSSPKQNKKQRETANTENKVALPFFFSV